MSTNENTFLRRLEIVEERIQRAAELSGRTRAEITLIAVSKKFPAGALHAAYESGLRDFGENYVQEFAEKRPELDGLSAARYHLIGHLQSNKARQACELFDVIQTVDSIKLMQRLDAAAGETKRRLPVLIEVKLSGEESKSGAGPENLRVLLDKAADCQNLELKGLMTMPPWSSDPEHARPYFQKLARLGREFGLRTLSMGMSGDLEVAIQEGATVIRVGTALFGPRPKPQPPV